jgi:hypothetical protein
LPSIQAHFAWLYSPSSYKLLVQLVTLTGVVSLA